MTGSKSRLAVHLATSACAFAMLAAAQTVHAQDDPESGRAQAETGSVFADSTIIVTARRRDEVLSDVPQTVSVTTGEALDRLQIEELGDLDKVVAGLQIDGPNLSMRGLSFSLAASSGPTVATYMNDAPVDSSGLFTSIFDVGQIEVLRGPQGTLRGISSPSGALTVTTRRPVLDEAGGYMKGSLNNLHGGSFEAALNIPIIADMLAIRLAGLLDRDGDEIRSVNSTLRPYSESIGKRVSLRFEPTPSIKVNLMYNLVEEKGLYFATGRDFRTTVFGSGSPGTANPFVPPNYNGPAIGPFDRRAAASVPSEVDNHNEIITAQAEWSFAGQKLSFVGSWQDLDRPIKSAGDDGNNLLGYPFYQSDYPGSGTEVDTQEVRLSSEDRIAGIFDYVVGFFHRKATSVVDGSEGISSFLPGAFGPPGTIPNPAVRPNERFGVELLINYPNVTRETSFFGNVTAHIGDRLEISAGLRKINFKLDRTATISTVDAFIAQQLPNVPNVPPNFVCLGAGGQYEATYPGICDIPIPGRVVVEFPQMVRSKPWVWDAAISYDVTPDLMVYAHAGSSWRQPYAGVGISPGASDPALVNQLVPFLLGGSEKSKSYEVGLKWSFLDNRAYLFLDGYIQKFNGLIYPAGSVRYLATDTTTRTNPFYANVPAKVKGFDIEVGFNPSDRLSLGANFSWSDGKVSGEIPCTDGDFDGVPDGIVAPASEFIARGIAVATCKSNAGTSSAPDWNVRAQGEYNLPVGDIGDGFIRGLFSYQPKNDNISQTYTTPAYGLLDVFIGIRGKDRAWEISAYGKNITRTRKILDQSADEFDPPANAELFFGPSGYRTLQVTEPREFGITARIAFGSR